MNMKILLNSLIIIIILIDYTYQFTIIKAKKDKNNVGIDSNNTTLKSVHILMRHGVRAPYYSYPKDPNLNNTDKLWPNGLSQLTDVGIQQMKNVGNFLKNHYQCFYPKDSKRALIRSSSVDRCLDSMAIVTNILWPIVKDKEWSRPRIFTLPQSIDATLYWGPYCPVADKETYTNNLNTDEVKKYDSEHKVLYDFAAEKSGLSSSMDSVNKVFDVLRSEKAHNYELPKWVNESIYNQLGGVFSDQLNFWYKSKLSQRLRAGPFLKELNRRLNEVIDSKTKKNRNLFLYLSHDYEVSSTLSALGVPQPKYPSFSAGIIFELHKIDNNDIIKVLYMNKTETLPIETTKLMLPKCASFTNGYCDLNAFKKAFAELIPENWKKECGIEENYDVYDAAESLFGKTDD